MLIEVDVGVEGREGADGEPVAPRARDDLPHAVAQHEDVARLGEAVRVRVGVRVGVRVRVMVMVRVRVSGAPWRGQAV